MIQEIDYFNPKIKDDEELAKIKNYEASIGWIKIFKKRFVIKSKICQEKAVKLILIRK